VLVDGDGKASSFLQVGESFAGYKLKAYDAKEAALDLERDGKVTRIHARDRCAVTTRPRLPRKPPGDAEAVLTR